MAVDFRYMILMAEQDRIIKGIKLNKWTNPNPNFNVDSLRSQYKVFSLVRDRMMKEDRLNEAKDLTTELIEILKVIIFRIEGGSITQLEAINLAKENEVLLALSNYYEGQLETAVR